MADDTGEFPVTPDDPSGKLNVASQENPAGEEEVQGQEAEVTDREYVELPANHADKPELAQKIAALAYEKLEIFREQTARERFEENMQTADRMWRASKVRARTTATDNQEDTLSNVASTEFNQSVRTTTSALNSTMFYGAELPVKYEPVPGSRDFMNNAEAQRIADGQNLWLRYNWDKDGYTDKLKRANFYVVKYGVECLEMVWDYCAEKRTERVPTAFDEKGKPTAYTFQKKKRIVADWASVIRHDMKDTFFDAYITDLQDQSCVLFQGQSPKEDLRRRDVAQGGEYLNTDKITDAQLFIGDRDEVEDDRQVSASEGADNRNTGNIGTWRFWVRLPVDPDSGAWDDKRDRVWFECVYACNNLNDATVPLLIRANPHYCGKLPVKLVYRREDDKGAYHLSDAELAECLYEEHTSLINGMFDNITLRTRKPFVAEKGNVLSRNLTFRQANQRIWVKPGTGTTALREIDIQDTTAVALPAVAMVREDMRRTLGTDRPISGEYAGARTSATEVSQVAQQAIKPLVEDVYFVANQVLPWVAWWTMELERQYADPEHSVWVKQQNAIVELKPAELYGEVSIRITSLGEFENDAMKRQAMTNFVQGAFPLFQPLMGKRGATAFAKESTKAFVPGVDVNEFFPAPKNADTVEAAWAENAAILLQGVEDYPKPEEDDETHLSIHEPYLAKYKLLPDDEQNPRNVQIMELHNQMHRDFMQQELAGAAPRNPQQTALPSQLSPAGAAPALLPGEVQGDLGGEVGGAIA